LGFAVSGSGWNDIVNELRQCFPVMLRGENLLSRSSYTRGVCRCHGRVVLLGLCDTHTLNPAHTVTLQPFSWPHAGPLLVDRNGKCEDLHSAEQLPLLNIKMHVLSKYCVVRRLERG
jgi:hypothetical protein